MSTYGIRATRRLAGSDSDARDVIEASGNQCGLRLFCSVHMVHGFIFWRSVHRHGIADLINLRTGMTFCRRRLKGPHRFQYSLTQADGCFSGHEHRTHSAAHVIRRIADYDMQLRTGFSIFDLDESISGLLIEHVCATYHCSRCPACIDSRF